jgi:CRP-like cAMP-binding protein
MTHPKILENIAKHIALDEHETQYFSSLLVERRVNAKEFLLKAGDTCRTINYVVDGTLRAYFSDEKGKDCTIMFAVQDWWITDMFAFANKKNAMLNIQALESSTVHELEKKDMDNLCVEVPKFERFFRIIMQNAYIREQLRTIENLSLPAAKRYENFLAKYPQFTKSVPLKQIASYLGITPEFLSSLRKNSAHR